MLECLKNNLGKWIFKWSANSNWGFGIASKESDWFSFPNSKRQSFACDLYVQELYRHVADDKRNYHFLLPVISSANYKALNID